MKVEAVWATGRTKHADGKGQRVDQTLSNSALKSPRQCVVLTNSPKRHYVTHPSIIYMNIRDIV